MYNDYVLKIALHVLPILALSFVLLLSLFKVYIKIRSKFNCKVNCWFCNEDSMVPYLHANSWTCTHCEQYNGFTKDGDYNKEIQHQQHSNTKNSSSSILNGSSMSVRSSLLPARNGFCDACNEAQRLKIEKLAQFEPKRESYYEQELKQYKAQLEKQYSLCGTCDRHLNKVLREKKKMVLGTKFLDLIMRSAKTFKQPFVSNMRQAKHLRWKRRCTLLIIVFTTINISCLFSTLPSLSRDWMTAHLGEAVGLELFKMLSHIVALLRVLLDYVNSFSELNIFTKVQLFIRTICMMLTYSLGLKWPELSQISFSSFYLQSVPFILLCLAFAYNLLDNFRMTRFTFLLGLWSIFASGLLQQPYSLMWLASILSCFLAITSSTYSEHKLFNTPEDTFHKIYAEDYFNDEETISLLSEQLSCSDASVCSLSTNRSPLRRQQVNAKRLTKSPLTSSAYSLMPSHAIQTPVYNSQTLSYAPNHNSLYATHQYGLQNGKSPRTFGCGLDNTAAPAFFNNSFGVANKSFGFTSQQRGAIPKSPLHSPYSLSSNNILQQHCSRANLLTPSRLSANCLLSNTAPNSWLNGSINNLQMQNNKETLSRESSQSSGFESEQNNRNGSRENSACSDATLVQRSAFKPIDASLSGARRPLPTYANFSQPLSVNCNMETETSIGTPKQLMPKRMTFGGSNHDSFNLRRINDELPQIQRGDLLKKWYQSQQVLS